MPCIRAFVSCCSLCVSYSPGIFHLYCVYVLGKGELAQRKGGKNSTFVFLAGVCVYTQTESHKKTGLEVEAFLSSFITTHDEGSVWRAFGAAYSNSSLGYRHAIMENCAVISNDFMIQQHHFSAV